MLAVWSMSAAETEAAGRHLRNVDMAPITGRLAQL